MFAVTKIQIDLLTLEELMKVANAFETLASFGIDSDRYQTKEYVEKRIAKMRNTK